MFLENVSGLAPRILRNFALSPEDAALVISSSGCNLRAHRDGGRPARRRDEGGGDDQPRAFGGEQEPRSAREEAPGFRGPGPRHGGARGGRDGQGGGPGHAGGSGSTIGGALLVNCIKAEVAQRLTRLGSPPKVLTASAVVGAERAAELFEAAYDEHARRLARLLERGGRVLGGETDT